ncbi:hypothetical protein ACFQY7_28620 [Actinomadura luteofluorescens]|uniref:hypothetical protein n=1 Tax=Actinomadura luteofluorescens TaxID=46163 RepID=UPI00363D1A00
MAPVHRAHRTRPRRHRPPARVRPGTRSGPRPRPAAGGAHRGRARRGPGRHRTGRAPAPAPRGVRAAVRLARRRGVQARRRGPHHPRLTLDGLVVARETWRTTVGGTGIAPAHGPREYLAARRLRRALGMPERVFAKVGTEVKPVYVDFTGPRYVSSFATLLRAARQTSGDDVPVVFTELLPDLDESWLPGADGRATAASCGFSSAIRNVPERGRRPAPRACRR